MVGAGCGGGGRGGDSSFSVIEGNTSAIISADGCGDTIFCGFDCGMVDDDDVGFAAREGGKDFCDATSMSRPGGLSFMISSNRAFIFGFLVG